MNRNEQKMAGMLLRMERTHQDKGLKEICCGICVTSYLSKIERGLGNPDQEILKQLFERLSIEYETDAAFLKTCRCHMAEYEKRMEFEWGTREEYLWLKERKERIKYSPLAVDWHLIECMEEGLSTTYLDKLEEGMNQKQRAYYYLLRGEREKNSQKKLSLYTKAQEILNNAFGMRYVIDGYFHTGNYNAIHAMENRCVSMALEEGNTYALADYYYMNASAYACVDMEKMMETYYKKVIHLLFHTQWKDKILPGLYYNMGSVYANTGKFDLAMKYLKMADIEDFLLFHKKALVCVRKGEIESAAPYFVQMQVWMDGKNIPSNVEKLMYQELLMECQPDFMENEEFSTLLEQLVDTLKKERHFGYLFSYRDIVINTYTKQRKYKKALEFERELSRNLTGAARIFLENDKKCN